jgi:hypothetical protein
MRKRKNEMYDPNKSEKAFMGGITDVVKVGAGAAVAVGALGLLGSLFGKK